jgi:hypothetical protein
MSRSFQEKGCHYFPFCYTADGLKLDVQQKAKSQVRQGFDQFWESPRLTRPEYTCSRTFKASSQLDLSSTLAISKTLQ